MTRIRIISAAETLLLILLSIQAQAKVDPNRAIDFRSDAVVIQGGSSSQVLHGASLVQKVILKEGELIRIRCDWSANLVLGVKHWKTYKKQVLQVVLRADENTFALTSFTIPAQTQMGILQEPEPGYFRFPTINDPAWHHSGRIDETHYPTKHSGSTKYFDWRASKPGTRKISCTIPKSGFEEPTLENNIAYAIIEVLPRDSYSSGKTHSSSDKIQFNKNLFNTKSLGPKPVPDPNQNNTKGKWRVKNKNTIKKCDKC